MAEQQAPQQQKPKRELREPKGRVAPEDQEPKSGRDAVEAIANNEKVTTHEVESATDWLLSDDPAVAPSNTRVLTVNAGTDEAPIEMDWTIRAIDGSELREVQRAASNPRAQRRAGGVDDMEVHARVVVEATVDPDIKKVSREKGSERGGARAPHLFLMDRFHNKPGVVTALSAEIMELSGFSDTQVREKSVGENITEQRAMAEQAGKA